MIGPKTLHFILTNRCNLRCVYCPEGSHPKDYYADMSDELFAELMTYIERVGVQEAGLAYYGEMTMVDGWWKKARELLDAGVGCLTTTNAHTPWSPEEIETLARFKSVVFSLDSHDEETVRSVRKKTSVARIVHNYHLLKAYCLRVNIPMPQVMWAGVLTYHIVHQLPMYVAFAASNGVTDVRFNEVQIYEGAVAKGLNIIDLEEEAFQSAVRAIDGAFIVANRVGVDLVVYELPRIRARQAGQKSDIPLTPRSTTVGPSAAYTEYAIVPEGLTRECGAAFYEMYMDPKGNIHSCSNRGAVMGRASTAAEIEQVYNNPAYDRLRQGLLKGGRALDPDCASCAMRPLKVVDGVVPK